MADVFSTSGENPENVAVPTPQLQGMFVPSIDNAMAIDGLGIVTPWGGGGTARRYGDYGPPAEVSRQSTQLNDLATGFVSGGAAYNLEGLVGPQGDQGIPGRDGLPGIITVMGLNLPQNSNFLAELPHGIDQINDLGTAVDKLLYTSTFTDFYDFVWTKMTIDAAVESWNDSDSNTDGSFFIVAADDGVYVSRDNGDSWAERTLEPDEYIQTSCSRTTGRAVVLGDNDREDGLIWVTEDYGVNWTEKTVIAEDP